LVWVITFFCIHSLFSFSLSNLKTFHFSAKMQWLASSTPNNICCVCYKFSFVGKNAFARDNCIVSVINNSSNSITQKRKLSRIYTQLSVEWELIYCCASFHSFILCVLLYIRGLWEHFIVLSYFLCD
jgi:hypothetical protein